MALVPPLPYAFDALDPHIDAPNNGLHHGKPSGVREQPNSPSKGARAPGKALDELLPTEQVPEAIHRGPQQLRRALNHTMFFRSWLRTRGQPSGKLGEASTRVRRLDKFKEQMSAAGVGRFGSGWAWLIAERGGGLKIESTANQDSPIMEGKTALMGIDVWEHAYYLKYQNRRPDYLAAWWNVANWPEIAKRSTRRGDRLRK